MNLTKVISAETTNLTNLPEFTLIPYQGHSYSRERVYGGQPHAPFFQNLNHRDSKIYPQKRSR